MKEYNVGDKVILNGKETEITEVAYDGNGGKMYGVKDSLNYHYDNELEGNMLKRIKNKIHKYISEWFKNGTVECMYCRKKLKKKDASIHRIANAVEYYHYDCYLNVKKYLWNGVAYVKVYEEEI